MSVFLLSATLGSLCCSNGVSRTQGLLMVHGLMIMHMYTCRHAGYKAQTVLVCEHKWHAPQQGQHVACIVKGAITTVAAEAASSSVLAARYCQHAFSSVVLLMQHVRPVYRHSECSFGHWELCCAVSRHYGQYAGCLVQHCKKEKNRMACCACHALHAHSAHHSSYTLLFRPHATSFHSQ